MSIYATINEWQVRVYHGDHSARHRVFFQGVPSGVTHEAPYLSPPIPDEPLEDGRIAMRDIFVVTEGTEKGTGAARDGQEYVAPLFRLSQAEYDAAMADRASRDRLRIRIRRALYASEREHANG